MRHRRRIAVGASLSTLSWSARCSGKPAVGHDVRKGESSKRVGGFTAVGATLRRCRLPYNKQLQRTVGDKVPRHIGQRAAAELRRYTATEAISSFELSLRVASRWRAVRNSVSPVREARWRGPRTALCCSHRAVRACSFKVGLGGSSAAASASRRGGRLAEHSVVERARFWGGRRRSRCQEARELREGWRFHSCWRYAQAVSVAV